MNMKLSKAERKSEILNAAKAVFLKKGFSKTTMEDIIAETSLSKGGVYYHYKSTKEMMFDMFIEGNNYRISLIKKYLEDNGLTIQDLNNEDILAELITQKALTVSPFMAVYAQFLIEAMYDEELYMLYNEIVQKTTENFKNFTLPSDGDDNEKTDDAFEFITNFINIFIVGSNILKANDNFMKNRPLIKEMIKTAIQHFKK